MTGRASNDNGRSLEYLIVECLGRAKDSVLTPRALRMQKRDAPISKSIDATLRVSLAAAAQHSSDWIISRAGNTGQRIALEIDRMDDGDLGVADIVVTHGKTVIPVSVKHNHDALSHPRPYSLAQALGAPKGDPIDTDHRARMKKISDEFRQRAGRAKTFDVVVGEKYKLYIDTCSVCSDTVTKSKSDIHRIGELFNFIVGPGSFKLTVTTNSTTKKLQGITIDDYRSAITPTSVVSSVDKRADATDLTLKFNNGWDIAMRIHNASSRISEHNQLSLKFDARRRAGPLPPTVTLL
jgi:hypothetical protein